MTASAIRVCAYPSLTRAIFAIPTAAVAIFAFASRTIPILAMTSSTDLVSASPWLTIAVFAFATSAGRVGASIADRAAVVVPTPSRITCRPLRIALLTPNQIDKYERDQNEKIAVVSHGGCSPALYEYINIVNVYAQKISNEKASQNTQTK